VINLEALIPVTVFMSVYIFSQAFLSRNQTAKVDIRGRLGQVISSNEIVDTREKELRRPLIERLILPLLSKITGIIGKALPTGMLKTLEPKVLQAGNPGRLSAKEILGIKALLATGIPALLYSLNVNGIGGMARLVLILAAAFIIGWKIPDLYLSSIITKKRKELEKTFPDILDLLTVSVEAGLGFDGAMAKVVEKDSGIVAFEFKRILQEIKMGKSRREALRDFAARSAVEDINSFVNAMVQSDQLGLSIAKTLRNQSEQMRRKRRQRVEEAAMKAPVKMLIPLVLFIFPCIFIILLGPALIQLIEQLGF